MRSKCHWLWLLTLLVVSCAPTPAPPPYLTPMLWQVSRTPSLSWTEPIFNVCIQEQEEYRVIVREEALIELGKSSAEIALVWGDPGIDFSYAYEVGEDELVFIVHPDNAAQSLPYQILQKVYSGEPTFWRTEPVDKASAIAAWIYAPGNEVQRVGEKVLGGSAPIAGALGPAPDISAMLEQVSQDANAIGFIPRRHIDPRVKPIQISDYPSEGMTFPILALLPSAPDTPQTTWLSCLQRKLAAEE